jgi:hypothetical protein
MSVLVVPAMRRRVPPVGVPVFLVDVGESDHAPTVSDWDECADKLLTVDTYVHDLSIWERA